MSDKLFLSVKEEFAEIRDIHSFPFPKQKEN